MPISGDINDIPDAVFDDEDVKQISSSGKTITQALSNTNDFTKYVSKMATGRHAAEYNMRHNNRGKAVIFNHKTFDKELKLRDRIGTDVDCANLTRALNHLHFNVVQHDNLTYGDILKNIKDVASEKHKGNDCLVVVILSHGEMGFIYAYDVQYTLNSIISELTSDKCPSLAGKPKLFFIQACQGRVAQPGVTMVKKHIETDGNSSQSFKLPIRADFLIAFSTIPGYFSWRNQEKGSWFIQALVAELESNGKRLDLLTMLTFVCQRVAVDFESSHCLEELDKKRQMPCINTMLTRVLLFSDKNESQTASV